MTPAAPAQALPSRVGESCSRDMRLTRDDIASFARVSGNTNPLHHDLDAAQRARHAELIASAEHSTALLIGLAASFFSRPGDGLVRELLRLAFNFACKLLVFAEQALELSWRVASMEWHAGLGGWPVQLDGRIAARGALPSVVSRGLLLLKARPADTPLPNPAAEPPKQPPRQPPERPPERSQQGPAHVAQ